MKFNTYATDTQKFYKLERITHKGDLYFVIFKAQEPAGLKHEDIIDLRNDLGCDIVLRSNGLIYFCQQITNAEIIEESNTRETVKENNNIENEGSK